MSNIYYAPANLNDTSYISGGIGDEIEGILINSSSTIIETDNRFNKLYEVKKELMKYLNNDVDYTSFGFEEKFDDDTIDDDLINKFNDFIELFKKQQTELISLENEIVSEYEKNKSDIKLIDTMLDNIKLLQNKYTDENMEISDKMCELGETIKKNSKIKEIRQRYIQARRNINTSLNFVRYINRFNKNNTCILCFSNSVDVFFDPCGHTCCRECSDNLSDNKRCFICRNVVHNVKKLYFS